jgi:integrase
MAGRQEHVDRRDNPWSGMELEGLKACKQRWTREQVETFCGKAKVLGWPSQALAVRLSWRLSLRESDVIEVTWAALDSRLVETSKTGADVPVAVRAYPDLRRLLRATKRTAAEVVVCETTGEAWGPDYFRHVFRDIANVAGLPADLQFRDLRATALTELADAGATDIQMGPHSGHLTAEMRRRYARRTPEQFEGAAELRLAQERKGKKGP